MVRSLAFYLPQYHPVPENDEWWGEGFTEWVNVKAAVPQWPGHIQPRVPTELGYYDLRDPEVMPAQMRLAREHGVDAFCYYMYWFGGGKTLLEKPLDAMLGDPKCDLPFCLFWANEPWTRTWKGHGHSVLQEQTYPEGDAEALAAHLARFFRDDRYVKVNGAPLLVIYRPAAFLENLGYIDRLKLELKRLGFPDLYLVLGGFPKLRQMLRTDTLKDAVELDFASHIMMRMRRLNEMAKTFDYADVIRVAATDRRSQRLYRSVLTGYDNTPRRGPKGAAIVNMTPEAYAHWLDVATRLTVKNFAADEQNVFIFAWNEWAESAYLEPDETFGRGFLEATRDVMARWNAKS